MHIERFLGRIGCSMSFDRHDNTSFWHNIMAMYQRGGYSSVPHDNHIICKPHGVGSGDETINLSDGIFKFHAVILNTMHLLIKTLG